MDSGSRGRPCRSTSRCSKAPGSSRRGAKARGGSTRSRSRGWSNCAATWTSSGARRSRRSRRRRGRLARVTLIAGPRLGPYEILAPLGAGGMGEVYRAKDTRLSRDVAVKVLPEHLSANPEIRAGFEREAKTVSSLNHPNICTLFDVGREGEVDFLVLELVEGETLAQRLTRGALPTPDLLRVGGQIADALDRAHRAGVVHRDLKPGNIMLTKAGAKLMDFGLARATGLAATAGAGAGGVPGSMTQSPTLASPLTAEGPLVGTFQYMS